jgi:hypothetical protein
MAITKGTLSEEYNIFKKEAFRSSEAGNFKSSLLYIDLCARIAYTFNFIYIDDELENLLAHISSQLLAQPKFKPEKRFVFYDFFGYDNQGLTQQYIRAMMSWGVEFLYILEAGDNLIASNDILTELASYSKAKVVILNGNRLDKITQAYNAIVQYKPNKAFLHFAPWDVIGVCVWTQFKNVQRFFINLTDHAFWLGKNCSDYIIEFRTYGHNLSVKARGISANVLFIQPYYPVQSESRFLGFNIDVSNKVIGFSGSAFHKIYGRGGRFLELIKKALNDNTNFIFLMAGEGYSSPILDFIKANHFEHRFILLGHRRDIDQVIKNIDIFINTYPISGGLMTQLAVLNNKALISYSSPDLSVNFVEDFLNVDREKVFSIKNEESFSDEINKLISDKKFRKENADLYRNSIPTVDEFNSGLEKIVLNPEKQDYSKVHDIPIDLEADQSVYFEIENNFYKQYDYLKLKYLGVKYFKLSPVAALKSVISSSFYNFELYKKILISIFR